MTFDGKCICSYGNDFARNVVIFGVDNTSSSHTDYKKNNIFLLGEGPTKVISDSVGGAEKNLLSTLVKERQNFVWLCIYNSANSYLYVSKTNLRHMITC